MTKFSYGKKSLNLPIWEVIARAKAEALAMPNTFVRVFSGYYLYSHNRQIYELEKHSWGWGWCELKETKTWPQDAFDTLRECKLALLDWLKI